MRVSLATGIAIALILFEAGVPGTGSDGSDLLIVFGSGLLLVSFVYSVCMGGAMTSDERDPVDLDEVERRLSGRCGKILWGLVAAWGASSALTLGAAVLGD